MTTHVIGVAEQTPLSRQTPSGSSPSTEQRSRHPVALDRSCFGLILWCLWKKRRAPFVPDIVDQYLAVMIMRTADQAKLLFFGLLRTVSALASTEHKVAPYLAQAAESAVGSAASTQAVVPEITLRLARRTDVPSIQRCNLASLPENYNQQFYANHLRQWPELAVVAEWTDPNRSIVKQDRPFHSTFPGGANKQNEAKIIAYVIGKVEEHSEMELQSDDESSSSRGMRRSRWGSSVSSGNIVPPPVFRTYKLGHVTSLAVLEPFRRRGLAQALMDQLHHHMVACYGVKSVGLHVRQSNTAAVKLYQGFGYEAAQQIPHYYQDGEDAYLMKKRLEALEPSPHSTTKSLFGTLRRAKPWENGPSELRLPREVGHRRSRPVAPTSEEEEAPSEGLLTGTM